MFEAFSPKVKRIQKAQSKQIEKSHDPVRIRLYHVLRVPAFDYFVGFLVLCNCAIIVIETDHGAKHDATLAWTNTMGWIYLGVFIAELSLRLYVFRSQFFNDAWNMMDFVIVVTDATFSLLGAIFGNLFPISILRVFRLGKLARVSKVFRVFPELRLMMAGLMGTVRSIFWGAVLLGFILMLWAIVAVQFIHPLNQTLTDGGYHEGCERCPRAYASVFDSILTFFQQIVAGDSWGQATIPVIEHYPATMCYFVSVFLSVGVAIMNLILGIVVTIAQQEHERLKTDMEFEHFLERTDAQEELLAICEQLDIDGSGNLSKEELINGYRAREDFRIALTEMDILEEDMEVVWGSLDADRSGEVCYKEFVQQMYKLKETDTSFMLASIKNYCTTIKDLINAQINAQSEELKASDRAALEKMDTVQQQLTRRMTGEDHDMAPVRSEEKKYNAKFHIDTEPHPTQMATACVSRTPSEKLQRIPEDGASPNSGIADQICKEVVGAVLNALQRNHGDMKGLVQDMKLTLDLNTASTSKLLSDLMLRRASDDLIAPPRHPRTPRLAPPSFLSLPPQPCCGHGHQPVTITVAKDDLAPTKSRSDVAIDLAREG